MTNTNTSKAPETAWDYSSSLLAGFYKAAVVANEEYAAAVAIGNGNPFAPGISQPHQLLLVLSNAKLQLEGEMRRIARSSGLAMPELRAATTDEVRELRREARDLKEIVADQVDAQPEDQEQSVVLEGKHTKTV